jgi:hypothetical protein
LKFQVPFNEIKFFERSLLPCMASSLFSYAKADAFIGIRFMETIPGVCNSTGSGWAVTEVMPMRVRKKTNNFMKIYKIWDRHLKVFMRSE